MVSTKPSDTKPAQQNKREGVVLNERGEEMPADKATAQRPKDAGKDAGKNPAPQPQSPGMPAGGE